MGEWYKVYDDSGFFIKWARTDNNGYFEYSETDPYLNSNYENPYLSDGTTNLNYKPFLPNFKNSNSVKDLTGFVIGKEYFKNYESDLTQSSFLYSEASYNEYCKSIPSNDSKLNLYLDWYNTGNKNALLKRVADIKNHLETLKTVDDNLKANLSTPNGTKATLLIGSGLAMSKAILVSLGASVPIAGQIILIGGLFLKLINALEKKAQLNNFINEENNIFHDADLLNQEALKISKILNVASPKGTITDPKAPNTDPTRSAPTDYTNYYIIGGIILLILLIRKFRKKRK